MTNIQVQYQLAKEQARANRINEALKRDEVKVKEGEMWSKWAKLPIDFITSIAKIFA